MSPKTAPVYHLDGFSSPLQWAGNQNHIKPSLIFISWGDRVGREQSPKQLDRVHRAEYQEKDICIESIPNLQRVSSTDQCMKWRNYLPKAGKWRKWLPKAAKRSTQKGTERTILTAHTGPGTVHFTTRQSSKNLVNHKVSSSILRSVLAHGQTKLTLG